jgi:flavin reductase (DIM6/NTAB) family NADH-FMN oxidoreductase RutF
MTRQDDLESIGRALALLPSGVCVLTCAHAGHREGMLASWVQQAAFEPPMISVSIKRGRSVGGCLADPGRFTLNLIGDGSDVLFRRFASVKPARDPFADLEATATEHGVELADAAGWLACETRCVIEAGDHNVYVAEVIGGRAAEGAKPRIHVRKTGLSY